MTFRFLLCVILLLSCELSPLINAAKPSQTKSPHISVHVQAKSNTITQSTEAPTSKTLQTQHKNYAFNKDALNEPAKSSNLVDAEQSTDTLKLFNDLKPGTSNFLPWNPYANNPQSPIQFPYTFPVPSLPSMFDNFSPFSQTPKFLPFLGYSHPFLIPFPLMMTPDMLYSSYGESPTIAEDTMSRNNARRPSITASGPNFSRNSPVYYVRLPPTPYMFLTSFNYAPTSAFPHLFSYPPVSPYHALPLSSILNMPLNFLANGKPSGIYRIDGAPNELPDTNFPLTGSQPNIFNNAYRPISSSLTPPPPPSPVSSVTFSPHSHSQFSFPSSPTSSTAHKQDSKLTSLKSPFVSNGRPEDIYILPNNFNPTIYSESSYF